MYPEGALFPRDGARVGLDMRTGFSVCRGFVIQPECCYPSTPLTILRQGREGFDAFGIVQCSSGVFSGPGAGIPAEREAIGVDA